MTQSDMPLDVQRLMAKVFADVVGREPQYAYFETRQHRFHWTTERMGDGKYAAIEYRPVGPGARTGKARRWKLVREVHFNTRAKAKARALKWYYAEHTKEES